MLHGPSQYSSRTVNTAGGVRNATARVIFVSGGTLMRMFSSSALYDRSLKKCSGNRSRTVLLSLYFHGEAITSRVQPDRDPVWSGTVRWVSAWRPNVRGGRGCLGSVKHLSRPHNSGSHILVRHGASQTRLSNVPTLERLILPLFLPSFTCRLTQTPTPLPLILLKPLTTPYHESSLRLHKFIHRLTQTILL